jgi:hypothetical protein
MRSFRKLRAFAVGVSFTPRTHRVDGFPVLRLLCPIRLLVRALEFRWALAYLLPTLLIILHKVSRVPIVRLKRNDLGGVFSVPHTALCGSLDCSQGTFRFTCDTLTTRTVHIVSSPNLLVAPEVWLSSWHVMQGMPGSRYYPWDDTRFR